MADNDLLTMAIERVTKRNHDLGTVTLAKRTVMSTSFLWLFLADTGGPTGGLLGAASAAGDVLALVLLAPFAAYWGAGLAGRLVTYQRTQGYYAESEVE